MTPDRRISWVLNGELTHVLPETADMPSSEMEILARKGAIKIVESKNGVEIRWVLFSANWASMYYLIETLHLFSGPYKFHYFLSGWFTETIESFAEAKDRIQQLLAKSDVHVSQHTFVKKIDPAATRVPHILRDTLDDMIALPEFSVDCVFDDDTNQFLVRRIGSNSTLAKIYGMSPVSSPCLTGNTYDQIVSAAYTQVIEDQEPYYDHVIAAMVFPDRSVSWLPYQRVILPHSFPDGRKGVSVVTEHAAVDIKVI